MNRLSKIFTLIVVGLNPPLYAETEFEDSIPVEFVKVFIKSSYNGEPVIYSDIPNDFPPLPLPEGFEVMGSINDDDSTQVFLRTPAAQTDAINMINDAFRDNYWSTIDEIGVNPPRPTAMFSFSSGGDAAGSFCHDIFRLMTVNVSTSDQYTVMKLQQRSGFPPAQLSCDTLVNAAQRRSEQARLTPDYMELMPMLTIDDDLNSATIRGFSGSSGDGIRNAQASSDFDSDLPVADMHTRLEDQLQDQDWSFHSKSMDETSALSVWSKSFNGGASEYYGFLTILPTLNTGHQFRFDLVRR